VEVFGGSGGFGQVVGRLLGLGFVLAAAACSQSVADDAERVDVSVPLSLYVLVDGDAGSELSSVRTTADVEAIALRVGEIWNSAGIIFDPVHVTSVEVPTDVLGAIAARADVGPFFDQIGVGFDVPAPGVINGFYVANAGDVNGFAPGGSRVFFVVDEPTVHDERVTSHEIGHLLGLHHAARDEGRLMFSGTNGMTLTDEEQLVARYAAEGLLDGVR
jgi:hypothetical protein